MGAFWNPSGGIVTSEKNLSNKEVLVLKQRKIRAGNPLYRFSPLRNCLENIWITVLALFSRA